MRDKVHRLAAAAWLFAASPLISAEITHGPILGRLGSSEIGVWTRTAEEGRFFVRYGVAAGALDQVVAAETQLGRDNTGWAHIRGLEPDTKYYYEVVPSREAAAKPEHRGAFHTLPEPAQVHNAQHNPQGLFNFSFEFACGNNQPANLELPAFATMLDHLDGQLDFAILNGDWLYEEKRDYSLNQWLQQVRAPLSEAPRIVQIAPTIVGVWENYKLYLRRGDNLAAWHREIPSFFTFDDHEILNDVNGAGSVGLRNRRAVFRDIGVEAWYHYLGWSNPVQFSQDIHFGKARLEAGSAVLVDEEADFSRLDLEEAATLTVHWGEPSAGVNDTKLDGVGGDPNAGVYEVLEVVDPHRLHVRPAAREDGTVSYSIGRRNYFRMRISNADFFVLDTRSHRELHDIDDPFKEDVSMIGERQKAWIEKGMSDSDADFLFVVSSVNLMVPHVGLNERQSDKDEAWTAIAAERNELIDFWDSLGKPVLVLTGDLHNSFAIKITDNVWEFASGPHNSGNHPARAESNRPPNGTFASRGKSSEIRWSTYFLDDAAPGRQPVYCVIQINNVFNNPTRGGPDRWVAFPRPQAVVQYYDGQTGKLLYAEPVLAQ